MKKDFFSKRVIFLLLVAFVLFFLDRALKFWIYHYFSEAHFGSHFYPYGGIGVFKNILGIEFSINRVMNTGGAWGVLGAYPIFLLVLRLGILCVMLYYTFFMNQVRKRDFPFILIITGAFGNILDHFLYGGVIDMFHPVLWGYSFPVFNVSDMMIFFGVITLLIQSISRKKYAKISNQSS